MNARKRRREGAVFAAAMVLVALITLLMICVNASLRRYASDGEMSSEDLMYGVLLDQFERTGWTVTTEIETPEDIKTFLYLKNVDSSQIRLNGEVIKEANGDLLAPVWLNCGQTYDLSITPAYDVEGYLVHLSMSWVIYVVVYGTNWAAIALYLLMIIYTLSLYSKKRSESYLLDFCAYLVVMLTWTIVIAMPELFKWKAIGRILFLLLAMYSVRICRQLTKPALPRFIDWFAGKGFWPCCAALIVLRLNPLDIANDLVILLLFATSIYVLACAVAQGKRDTMLLLLGMVLLTGMRPSTMLYDYSVFGRESFIFYIIRSQMRIHDLIFILTALIYVNREFAWQFAEKERLAAHLDELVQERTQELVSAQQKRQSMMLNIFHDVRTPLAVMRGALDAIEMNPAAAEEMMPLLSSRLDFVIELSGDLFLTAKLEDGQVLLNYKRVNLSALLEEHCAHTRREAEAQQVTLRTEIEPGLVIWGDSVRLKQIAQNLLNNALHYTPEGGTIRARLESLGEEIVFSVADSGKGIAKEDQAHIFDRYFHTTEENKHESSGLGLTIARELTALHRGTLSVKSALGRGTMFIARFPKLEDDGAS